MRQKSGKEPSFYQVPSWK